MPPAVKEVESVGSSECEPRVAVPVGVPTSVGVGVGNGVIVVKVADNSADRLRDGPVRLFVPKLSEFDKDAGNDTDSETLPVDGVPVAVGETDSVPCIVCENVRDRVSTDKELFVQLSVTLIDFVEERENDVTENVFLDLERDPEGVLSDPLPEPVALALLLAVADAVSESDSVAVGDDDDVPLGDGDAVAVADAVSVLLPVSDAV